MAEGCHGQVKIMWQFACPLIHIYDPQFAMIGVQNPKCSLSQNSLFVIWMTTIIQRRRIMIFLAPFFAFDTIKFNYGNQISLIGSTTIFSLSSDCNIVNCKIKALWSSSLCLSFEINNFSRFLNPTFSNFQPILIYFLFVLIISH